MFIKIFFCILILLFLYRLCIRLVIALKLTEMGVGMKSGSGH